MTANQEKLIETLEEIIDNLETLKQGLGPTFNAALNALERQFFSPPPPVMNWVRGEVNRAVNDFNGCVNNGQDYCRECVNNTRHCFTLRHTEDLYRGVSFAQVKSQADVDAIAGDVQDAWRSLNRDEYVTRLKELQDRVTRVENSIKALVDSLDQMASAIEGRDVDLAIGAAGIIVALAGILIAVETGITGVGAIVGLVIAVVGLALTVWGFVRVFTIVPARRDEMIGELQTNASNVANDPWTAAPRLTDTDW